MNKRRFKDTATRVASNDNTTLYPTQNLLVCSSTTSYVQTSQLQRSPSNLSVASKRSNSINSGRTNSDGCLGKNFGGKVHFGNEDVVITNSPNQGQHKSTPIEDKNGCFLMPHRNKSDTR